MTEVERIAKGLSEAQRRVIKAASAKRSKGIGAIFRHAKVNPLHGTVMHFPMWRLLQSEPIDNWTGKRRLTPLGLKVRAYLEKETTHE